MTNLDSILKSRDIILPTKVHIKVQKSYGFSSSCVGMWELDCEEGWAPKNWCFQIVVLDKTLESPLDCKEIKPFNPKKSQPSWEGLLAEAEAPILWPPDVKNRLIRKDPDAGKDWRQKEEGVAEDEMVGWHLNSMDMSLSKLQETVEDRGSCMLQSIESKSQMQFREWTTTRLCLRLSELRLCTFWPTFSYFPIPQPLGTTILLCYYEFHSFRVHR